MSWRAAFSAAGINARKPPNFFLSFAVLVLVLCLLHQCLPAGSLLYVCSHTLLFQPISRREKVKIEYSTFYIILVPEKSRETSTSAGSLPANICDYPPALVAVCRCGKGRCLGFSQVKVRLWSGSLENTYRIRQTLSTYELYLLSLPLCECVMR